MCRNIYEFGRGAARIGSLESTTPTNRLRLLETAATSTWEIRMWQLTRILLTVVVLTGKHSIAAAELQQTDARPSGDSSAIAELKLYLREPVRNRKVIGNHDFAHSPLGADEVEQARRLIANDRLERIRQERRAEMESRVLTFEDKQMRFCLQTIRQQAIRRMELVLVIARWRRRARSGQ